MHVTEKAQEQESKNVEYIGTSTSILKKNPILNEDDEDDDILNPETALMHSDLATITELSTDIDEDDLTLHSSSLESSSIARNNFRPKSYRQKVSTQQIIKEVENESQSASSFSNKLDLMESQLKQLRIQHNLSQAIDYEPLDEISPQEEKQEIQKEQQYKDFSNVISSFLLQNDDYENKKDYYFDDSSTITSMQTKIKNKQQPLILFEWQKQSFSAIPEEKIQSPKQEPKTESQEPSMFIVPEEISVKKSLIQEKKKHKDLKSNQSSSSLTPTVALSSMNDDTSERDDLKPSVDESKCHHQPLTIHEESKEILQQSPEESSCKSNDKLLNNDNNHNDATTIVRSSSIKKKTRRKDIVKYTIIVLIILTVITVSNLATKHFSDGSSKSNDKTDSVTSDNENVDTGSDENNDGTATNTTVVNSNSTNTGDDTRERDKES